MVDNHTSGRLILVAGPSGAGKDTLLAFAQAMLADRYDIKFAQRIITRPIDVTERHQPISEAEFTKYRDNGEFALSWNAHGMSYGISKTIELDLAAGRQVVANVSRGIIGYAKTKYRCFAIEITASPERLRNRLLQRGRENDSDVALRLQRSSQCQDFQFDGTVTNDRSIEEAGTRLVALIDNRETASGAT